MAQGRSYKRRAIVLRKTKLAEKDLIVTMLCESGAIVRAVAKGARKPGGSLAARIEVFSCVDALLAPGRTLDVVAEARLANDIPRMSYTLEQSSCAAAVAELASIIAEVGLEQPRLYDLVLAALTSIGAHDDPSALLSLTAAALLKAMAIGGFRPSLSNCVSCGSDIDLAGGKPVAFSYLDGGSYCANCSRPADCLMVDAAVLSWAHALLFTRFDDIPAFDIGVRQALELLQFARQWARAHAGRNLKSVDFLFTSGLF